MPYDELVKRLREHNGWALNETLDEAADAIEKLSAIRDEQKAQIILMAAEIEEQKPRWIPVSERLPKTGVDVLVKFPQNMAVASIDIGEWVVNSGDGWCTDINLAGGEKNPTHWMPLPQGPEEET